MILTGLLGVAPAVKAETTAKFYRWNPGYRAESEAAYEWKTGDEEFRRFLHDPRRTEGSPLYSGCYLVRAEGGRFPASAEKSPLYRVCLR